jgi:hypothetical protein
MLKHVANAYGVWTLILRFGTPIWDPDLGPRFGTPIWDPDLGPQFGTPICDPDLGPQFGLADLAGRLVKIKDGLKIENQHFFI